MKHSFLLIGLTLIVLLKSINSQEATSPKHEDYISFHWKGGLTSHSIILKVFPNSAALSRDSYNAFIACYTTNDDSIGDLQIEQLVFDGETYPVATVEMISLKADTKYHYTFIITGDAEVTEESFTTSYSTNEPNEFEFRTLGIALKPYNFTFGASCCAQTGSTNKVFDYLVADEDFQFFIHTGDLHSEAIEINNVEKFYDAYYKVLNSSAQKKFFQEYPIFYVWDDQDFGAANANGNSASRPAATQAYTRFVPASTPKQQTPKDDFDAFGADAIVATNPENQYVGGEPTNDEYGIYRSFIVGRCLFIIMDLKSYKDIQRDDILGSDQRSWLQNQLIFAKANDNIVQVFLISSIPWIHTTNTSDWGPYAESTQQFIRDWVKDYTRDGRGKVMLIGGEAHMVAFDDGSSNVYGGFPVVQAGALDQNPSCKGGPYSHGLYTGRERFATFNVIEQENGTLCIKVHLENINTELIFYDTCHPKKNTDTSIQTTCPTYENEEATQGTSSWLIVLIGLALLGIVGYLVWGCVNNAAEKPEEGKEQREGTYMELSETRKKRENDQL